MNSAICTLFEGHYHHGVAALVNSVYKNGYRGSVFAGYKGSLPKWASSAKKNCELSWEGAVTLAVSEDLEVHFIRIDSELHLTNYKPFFLLDIFKRLGKAVEAIFYFDPDIVIKCHWKFFENWLSHGVALVEDINHNMSPTHPLRMEWLKVILTSNKKVTRNLHSYFNGGFCGLSRQNIEFLQVWVDIISTSVQHFNFTPDKWVNNSDRSNLFYKHDQDTLNIAVMCCISPICEMGPEAMDFKHGGWTMSHAVGQNKPWNKNFLWSAIKGNPPSLADKAFWSHVSEPIAIRNIYQIQSKYISILVASFMARFYRKG